MRWKVCNQQAAGRSRKKREKEEKKGREKKVERGIQERRYTKWVKGIGS